MLVLLLGERPSVRPLLPVVLPFIELPTVVELALGPPAAELPPAEEPALVPGLCANELAVLRTSAAAVRSDTAFMCLPF